MVLSGMSNLEQMLDNTGYMGDFRPITDGQREKLFKCADIINNYTLVPCTACRYCTEGCPQGIEIPDIFAMYNLRAKEKLLRAWGSRAKEQYAEHVKDHPRATDCIQCRQCEGACPQHLPIVDTLKAAAAELEG